MLLTILGILKAIGIVLLAVLGLLLLMILLILFVPLRYKVSASVPSGREGEFPPKDTRLDVRFSWLLHLINGGYTYNDDKGFYVRLAVFKLFPKPEKEKKDRKDKGSENKPAAENSDKTETVLSEETDINGIQETDIQMTQESEAAESEEASVPETAEKPGEIPPGSGQEEHCDDSGDSSEEGHAYSGKKRKNNKNYTISSVCDKIEKVCSTLDNPIFERALKCVKKEMVRIARWIMPSGIRGSILAGTGDPYSTAQVMAGYGIIYPLLKGRLSLDADFERRIIEGELDVRGKLRLIVPVMSALRLLLNRDVRKTVKRFKYIAEA